MNNKLGRNDSCHCGSGKKFKACHGQFNNKSQHLWIIAIVLVSIVLWFFFFDSGQLFTSKSSSSNSSNYQTPNRLSPPSDTAPPGKVWSPEHGHWHNVSDNILSSENPNPLLDKVKTQPNNEAPPGKVWSPEHGHWHDEEE